MRVAVLRDGAVLCCFIGVDCYKLFHEFFLGRNLPRARREYNVNPSFAEETA
jgi:hypothetical protein